MGSKNKLDTIGVIALVILIIAALVLQFMLTKQEQEKKDSDVIITDATSHEDIKALKKSVSNFILYNYAANSKEDADSSIDDLGRFMTVACLDRIRSETNEFNSEYSQSVSVQHVKFGSAKNQPDNTDKVLAIFSVFDLIRQNKTTLCIEFSLNPDGKIFKYNVWRY